MFLKSGRAAPRQFPGGPCAGPLHYFLSMKRAHIEKISKALADETRLRIFQAISAREYMNCGQIVSLRGVTPATVSHHLKVLQEAGLIECCRQGQYVHSRPVPEKITEYTRALAKLAQGKSAAVAARRNASR